MAERRRDPTNPKESKKTYTREQFIDFYGPQHGGKMWKKAPKDTPAGPAERRRDPTNPPEAKKTYTREQFIDFYGKKDGAKMWNSAGSLPKPKGAKKQEPKKKEAKKKEAKKEAQPKQEITVGYWAIRGLGAPLRMMCFYRGAKMNEKNYKEFDDWFKGDKPGLLEKNSMINLPYVTIGDTIVSQTNACLKFLGKRLGIDRGNSIINEQALCETYDLRDAMVALVYAHKKGIQKDHFKDEALKHLSTELPKYYTKLNGAVKGDYLDGKKPRSADFHLWEMLDQHEILAKHLGQESPIAKYDKLKGIYEGMRKLPQLEKYFESDSYKLPLNVPGLAHFTGLE